MAPFFTMLMINTFLVALVPEVSTFLPDLIFGPQ
jgi:hypothetical protein